MSLNRINCDSRCTCLPVELEQQQIAVAPKLMNKSLPTTLRPSPDRERCVIPNLNRKLEIRAKGFLPKRSNLVRRILSCNDVLPTIQPSHFHLNWLSQGKNMERLKEEGVLR